MNIFVVGSTGYLGTKVARLLLEEGHYLYCLKRPKSNIKKFDKYQNQITWVDINGMKKFFSNNKDLNIDCYLNMSCRYINEAKCEEEVLESNFSIPLITLLYCRECNLQKVVTVGTSLPKYYNLYTYSKWMFFAECLHFADQDNFIVCNACPEYFYGIDEPKNRFIASTICKLKNNEDVLLTEGTQKRDFVNVVDVARIINNIVVDEIKENSTIPIGTGVGVTIKDAVKYLKKIIGSTSTLKFGSIKKGMKEPDSVADTLMIKKLGYNINDDWKSGFFSLI